MKKIVQSIMGFIAIGMVCLVFAGAYRYLRFYLEWPYVWATLASIASIFVIPVAFVLAILGSIFVWHWSVVVALLVFVGGPFAWAYGGYALRD